MMNATPRATLRAADLTEAGLCVSWIHAPGSELVRLDIAA